ncbi:flagellar biosynthesis anti-sigma factor FlgM [Mariniblastus fucicola]|uniref:Anti-sigma-28 factor, FlgM n=1 Tax=Mariniblastus fucicola TaxID=980251 RepID=A0A5B9PA89_9BACT|nr:flagellar biosynthesis anti-sigma factor FlgM [Mariniblastus fucicola]QEG23288.1 Anti-sigma-28 factor, FlgM [Mariniblastus fucicola]
MQIRPTSNVQSTSSVNLHANNATSSTDTNHSIPVDQVDISSEAQSITQTGTDFRSDRVNEIRAQISSGVYETPAKIDAAISRLLDEIA